ncbi:hypothetical protein ACFQ3K_03365 [Brucella gallinifaecis]|uniref:Uncharacterized protein n=1 Tax=Brucella gallinifaecis TaxID=215590 RepID=A0A502BMS9_9HYPH|nr:hypothetical protein [Brucella gallinifaecis]TPF75200.1 hypothetical protein FHY56_10815 [Brucella gallinifaecis]
MSYLAIGHKPGVGPVVKVMRNNADDFRQVPSSNFGAYLFNSENQNISYMKEPGVFPIDGTRFPFLHGEYGFYTVGGNNSNAKQIVITQHTVGGGTVTYFLLDRMFPGDAPPIFEAKAKRHDGRFLGPSFSINSQYQIGMQYRTVIARMTDQSDGPFDSWQSRPPATQSVTNRIPSFYNYYGWCGRVTDSLALRPEHDNSYWNTASADIYYTFWDLPADQSPIPKPSAPVVAGQEVVRLDSNGLIIARPGFSVDNSSGRQRIIDSTRNPPFCIMADEISNIPAGGNYFVPAPYGVSLTESMFVDIIAGIAGRDYVVPIFDRELHNTNQNVLVTYRLDTNGVTFFNESANIAVNIRYLVYCNDLMPPSSGGNQVMRRVFNDIQIKKPGSSDTSPAFNDILLDTRFPATQILAEAFIPTDQFNESPANAMYGEVAKTIHFNGSGMLVFPKVVGVFPNVLRQSYAALYKIPSGSGAYGLSNQSVVSVLGESSLKIHISPSQATGIVWNGPNRWNYDDSFPGPLGVRYYILGVAKR